MAILSITSIETVLEKKIFTSGIFGFSNEISKITYVNFSNGNRKTKGEILNVISNEKLNGFKNVEKIRKSSNKVLKSFLEDKIIELNKLMQLS